MVSWSRGAAVLLLAIPAASAADLQWYRCNTHTHTSAPPKSDANATSQAVAEWYRTHGYQCLFITDHEYLTDVAPINTKYPPEANFLVIQGQEITQMMKEAAHPDTVRHFHINGLGITGSGIKPVGYPDGARDTTPLALYTRNMAEIRAAGGLPQINHPNLEWSASAEDVPRDSGPFLLEIWNAAPASNNLGGIDANGRRGLSPEELWDELLSRGERVWGVASDDAHEYQRFDDHVTSTPGKAWISVHADSLTATAILKALREGQFYASTGVSLEAYSADSNSISLTISPRATWTSKRKPNARYATRFIGANGRVLAEVYGLNAEYRFKGDERYVRASIVDSDGKRAWTQPILRNAAVQSRCRPDIGADGTVRTPSVDVPLSRYLSEEGRQVCIDANTKPAVRRIDIPSAAELRKAQDESLTPKLLRLQERYPVEIASLTIANVPTRVVTPKRGIPAKNRRRVLLNLHGGGFLVGSNVEALVESVPIAGVAGMKVITIDYRQGPENRYPAATEDVINVYREVMKQSPASSIGIYGCSAGGILTSQVIAALAKQGVPLPGAIGIFSSGAYAVWNGDPGTKGTWGGDSRYWADPFFGRFPRGLAQNPAAPVSYFDGVDISDPAVSPAESIAILAKFPPTLVLTGTRAYDMSAAVQTHRLLVNGGVDAELHAWDGLGHCFLFDGELPESREAYEVAARFFNEHLK